jgi:hypothetical protein
METAEKIRAQLAQLVRLLNEVDGKLAIVQSTDDVIKLDQAASEARSLLLEATDIAHRFVRQASGIPEPDPETEE